MTLFWPLRLDDLIGPPPTYTWHPVPVGDGPDPNALAAEGYVFITRDSTAGPPLVQRVPPLPPGALLGWECPRCHTIYAPHVPACACARPEEAP